MRRYYYYTQWITDLGDGPVKCHSGWISERPWGEFCVDMLPGPKTAMEFGSLGELNKWLEEVGLPIKHDSSEKYERVEGGPEDAEYIAVGQER